MLYRMGFLAVSTEMKKFMAVIGVVGVIAAVVVWLRLEGEKGAEGRMEQEGREAIRRARGDGLGR